MKTLQLITTSVFGILSCLSFLGAIVNMFSQHKIGCCSPEFEHLHTASHNSLIMAFTVCGICFTVMFLIATNQLKSTK